MCPKPVPPRTQRMPRIRHRRPKPWLSRSTCLKDWMYKTIIYIYIYVDILCKYNYRVSKKKQPWTIRKHNQAVITLMFHESWYGRSWYTSLHLFGPKISSWRDGVSCQILVETMTGWWCNNHLEKYESQWEGWHPIYKMENNPNVPNHQIVTV